MCVLLPRQLLIVWGSNSATCLFLSGMQGPYSDYKIKPIKSTDLFVKNDFSVGGSFSSELHFCIAINNGTIDFRISGESEVRVPTLPQNANPLQLLWFGLRFWEEQLDIQKMQQNVAWQERGKVYKNTHMCNLYWERKYSCSAYQTSDCIFQTYCTILVSKLLAQRNWERYHHLFYLLLL